MLAALLLAVALALLAIRACSVPPAHIELLRATAVPADSVAADTLALPEADAGGKDEKRSAGRRRRKVSAPVGERRSDRPSPREPGQEVPLR